MNIVADWRDLTLGCGAAVWRTATRSPTIPRQIYTDIYWLYTIYLLYFCIYWLLNKLVVGAYHLSRRCVWQMSVGVRNKHRDGDITISIIIFLLGSLLAFLNLKCNLLPPSLETRKLCPQHCFQISIINTSVLVFFSVFPVDLEGRTLPMNYCCHWHSCHKNLWPPGIGSSIVHS